MTKGKFVEFYKERPQVTFEHTFALVKDINRDGCDLKKGDEVILSEKLTRVGSMQATSFTDAVQIVEPVFYTKRSEGWRHTTKRVSLPVSVVKYIRTDMKVNEAAQPYIERS